VQNCRRYLAGEFPRHKLVDTPSNAVVWDCLESRVGDPDHPEDVLKTDADENGLGGDDAYDMWRYGLASRPLVAKIPPALVTRQPDRAPMIDYARGKPGKHLTGQQELQRELARRESPITQRVPIRHKVGR
jgi:hypothetical protein